MEDKTGMAIHFDKVHIITVNFSRNEARLFENGGATEGTLIFKKDEAAAKASIEDPMKLVDMALSYGVSYDLLARVASEHALKVFETLGVKAFLDKMLSLTTEKERHQRFDGFLFSFAAGITNGNGSSKQTETPSNAPKDQPPANGEGDATTKRRSVKTP